MSHILASATSKHRTAANSSLLDGVLTALAGWPDRGLLLKRAELPRELCTTLDDHCWRVVAHLNMQDLRPRHIGIGVNALALSGAARAAALLALCKQAPYPCDTIIPGMLAAGMLEFRVDVTTQEVRLLLLRDWSRALGRGASHKQPACAWT
jgi:hypothetical protein